jgi:hypothetical protein
MTENNIRRFLIIRDGKIDTLTEVIGSFDTDNEYRTFLELSEREYILLKLFDGDLVGAIKCARELLEHLEMLLN